MMNVYGVVPGTAAEIPASVTYSNVTQPEREPTLTDLIGLSDQLQAAVQDVADAWICFQQGKEALQNAGLRDVPMAMPVSTYRIDRLHSEMHGQIAALQRIANDIRGRI